MIARIRAALALGLKSLLLHKLRSSLAMLGILIANGALSPRSVAIATYALCGFANPGSMGVQLAILGSLCPERKTDFARVVVRAFVAGSAACFLTACIAGALYTEDMSS